MSGRPTLRIVGAGMDGAGDLTARAARTLADAPRLFAPARLADALRPLHAGVVAAGPDDILRALRGELADAVVAVSGDTGFFSLAATLTRELDGVYDIDCLPGVSSLQALCSRLRLPWQEARTLSVHGRPEALRRVAGTVSHHARTCVLAGAPGDVEAVLAVLRNCAPGLRVHLGERLHLPGERLRSGSAAELAALAPFAGLAVLLVDNPAPADPAARLRDEDFARGDAPMTKEAVRTLAADRLDLRPADVAWDVGAGTGSVSVALARRAREGAVLAVERAPAALDLLRRNRERLGAYNIEIVAGAAPAALGGLPAPDAVFVGGSGGELPAILRAAHAANPAVRVCVTAVTLETPHAALTALQQLGFRDLELDLVQVSHARQAGAHRLLRADNPVWIISGRGAG